MTPRSRFALVLGVFVAWVAALGFLALTTAEKPQPLAVEVPPTPPTAAPAPAR